MSRGVILGLLLAAIVALALRCPELGVRPMHNDEGVNALKFRPLWEHGAYQYNPNEYHGPTLAYAMLAWSKLTRAPAFVDFDEARFRFVTVLFGVGLILLLPLIADGLGRNATICAGVLTAISPAMVFYSRYYIHEMLLVFFTFLALAAGWRYWRGRRIGWALLAGAAFGSMHSTKETFVLSLAAMAIALGLNCLCAREKNGWASKFFPINPKHAVAALAVWIIVAAIFFTSFFTNAHGLVDSVRTYLPWLNRVAGDSPHIHPWNFYLARLAFFHVKGGPVWSEGLILGLAIVGGIAAFTRKAAVDSNAGFLRFLVFYTITLTVIYSVIAYKTPWCELSFLHGMILLAGVGATVLVNWIATRPLKIVVAVLLIGGTAQLASQAWQAGTKYSADRGNPSVYAQTSPDLLNLVAELEALAKVQPQGHDVIVKVMAPENDYGPLPWYLRRFNHVGWWGEVPIDPLAPVMIVSPKFNISLDDRQTHTMVGIFQLRPAVFLELYVENDLWHAYLAAKPPAP